MFITCENLESIMALAIHDDLKNKLNAGVFVIVEGDDLVVKIKNDFHIWECNIADYMKMVNMAGFDRQKVVNKIVGEYKKEVLSWYFKK